MKFDTLVEQTLLNEKLFRLSGKSNPIISKAASEFMKNNKKIKSKEEFEEAISDQKSIDTWNNTLLEGIFKKIPKEDITYVWTNTSIMDWECKEIDEKSTSCWAYNNVNIGLKYDADARKHAKKVRGNVTRVEGYKDKIYGEADGDDQNIVLGDSLLEYLIENK